MKQLYKHLKKLEAEAISTGFHIEQCKQAQVKQVIEKELGVVCRPHDISDGLHLVSSGSENIDRRLLQTF